MSSVVAAALPFPGADQACTVAAWRELPVTEQATLP